MDGRWNRDRPDMPQRVRLMAGRVASRTRSPGAVLAVIGLVAVVLVSAIVISMTRATTPGQAAAADYPPPPVVEAPLLPSETSASPPPEVSSTSPSAKPSKSSSPKPGQAGEAADDDSGNDSGGDSGGDSGDPAPEPKSTTKPPAESTSTPSRPEAFGAWWASPGKYTAKWERPSNNGGLAITGYVLRKCGGAELARVGAGTFRVDVYHSSITCMTVQAINAKGEGRTAYFDNIK
ncbi:hypothetical protein AB0I28_16565 [Phytomonospora sp. NPDC050363]|uniref:hypothetical protein n=1 Tax=Phytomonospora sp. NPDC050363 TaxID=3155642 RepID=UPI0033E6171D